MSATTRMGKIEEPRSNGDQERTNYLSDRDPPGCMREKHEMAEYGKGNTAAVAEGNNWANVLILLRDEI